MSRLPLKAHHRSYRGGKRDKLQKMLDANRAMDRIADYVNRLILGDPNEMQTHHFAFIAINLKCDVELVREALYDGYNGLIVRVTDEDRDALRAHLGVREQGVHP